MVAILARGLDVEIVVPISRVVAVEMAEDGEPFLKFVVANIMGLLLTRVDRRRSVGC